MVTTPTLLAGASAIHPATASRRTGIVARNAAEFRSNRFVSRLVAK
jgi:hypothetical protein